MEIEVLASGEYLLPPSAGSKTFMLVMQEKPESMGKFSIWLGRLP